MDTSRNALSDHELMILYKALCAYTGSQEGRREFHNADPGHPVYGIGARGRESSFDAYGDSPERNSLFQLGHALHNECVKRSAKFFENCFPSDFSAVFSSWENFCECAFQAYCKQTKPPES